ncbi:MAG: sulfotransferase [Lewinellaceae bacterium]|nr:sulfotransferase [Lewinellaceae bacterium]
MLNRLQSLFYKVQKGGAYPNDILKYEADPEFPFLISFPRSGSHWLRIMLELYSNRPLLVRSFFNHHNRNYLLFHDHDLDLTLKKENVIYLYREPSAVIYSQMAYHQQSLDDEKLVLQWAYRHAIHLAKWLFLESSTQKKTVISYEDLTLCPQVSFEKICRHLGLVFDEEKYWPVYLNVKKEYVQLKTKHDKQVINSSPGYELNRKPFIKNYSGLINRALISVSAELLGEENKLIQLFHA